MLTSAHGSTSKSGLETEKNIDANDCNYDC